MSKKVFKAVKDRLIMKKSYIILFVIVLFLSISILTLFLLLGSKYSEKCNPDSIDKCDRSCNENSDCIFYCEYGEAISINQEFYKPDMDEILFCGDFIALCKENVCERASRDEL